MRNIDNDIKLFTYAKRYHNNEITVEQLHWALSNLGYKKLEIESSTSDYYWIFVRTPIVVNYYLIPICVICILILILMFWTR